MKIIIVFYSMHGHIHAMAEAVAHQGRHVALIAKIPAGAHE